MKDEMPQMKKDERGTCQSSNEESKWLEHEVNKYEIRGLTSPGGDNGERNRQKFRRVM